MFLLSGTILVLKHKTAEDGDKMEEVKESVQLSDGKKRKKGHLTLLAVILPIVLVVGVFAGAKVVKKVQYMVMSPLEYYRSLEREDIAKTKKILHRMEETFGEISPSYDGVKKITVKTRFSKQAKALMNLSGVDFANMKNPDLEILSSACEEGTSIRADLLFDGKRTMTANLYQDKKEDRIYAQVPLLSEAYLASSPKKEQEGDTAVWQKLFSDAGELSKVYARYGNVFLKHAGAVKKSEKMLEVDGIKQDCTLLQVENKAESAKKLLDAILKEAQSDNELANMMNRVKKGYYNALIEKLQSVKENMISGKTTDAFLVKMDVYANNDKIIGRDVTVTLDNKKYRFYYAMPYVQGMAGIRLFVAVNNVPYITISGNGGMSGQNLSGDLTLSVDDSLLTTNLAVSGKNLIKIHMEDFVGFLSGGSQGKIILSTDSITKLVGYTLEIDRSTVKTNEEKFGTFRLFSGKAELIEADVFVSEGEKIESLKPDKEAKIFDATKPAEREAYQFVMNKLSLANAFSENSGIKFSVFS